MKLVVAVPAYNEAPIIGATLSTLREALDRIEGLESHIVVADNGSTDDTSGAVTRANVHGSSVLLVPVRGKGAAVRHAAARVPHDTWYGFVDADLSSDPAAIAECLAHLSRGADIVIGSRLLNTKLVHRGYLRTLSSRAFNRIRRALLPLPSVRDTQCGFKFMNQRGREALLACREDGWFFDLELLAHAQQRGLTVIELPVAWEEQRYAGRRAKLSLLRDGFGALAAMVRIRRRLARARVVV